MPYTGAGYAEEMPKIIDYDARRREIAAKSVPVLVRDGIQEANLGKIADECGMGRTTLYQYFRNIGELIEFTLAEVFEGLDAEANALLKDASLGSAERLLRFMRYLEREAIQDKDRMVLVLDFLLHPQRRTPGVAFNVQERVRRLRAELERILERAVAEGELRPLDPKSMAFTLFAFVEAATIHGALYDNISLDNTMRDIDILIAGLRA
jgi:AcrR family transcriptional regulator